MIKALTLETVVTEESDVLGALLVLGQLSKDQESLPALAFPKPNTLKLNRQVVEIAFGDTSPPHDALGTDMLESEVDKRKNDTDREDPFRDIEGDELGRLDLGTPFVEDEELDSSEGINAVDSD